MSLARQQMQLQGKGKIKELGEWSRNMDEQAQGSITLGVISKTRETPCGNTSAHVLGATIYGISCKLIVYNELVGWDSAAQLGGLPNTMGL